MARSAKDRLGTYRAKRDFGSTPEPSPEAKCRKGAALPTFVVHKHDATRLHYDLRLEMGGVLASWALPKGPSYDPAVKRLAVETEDHPLAYGDFEGRIPDGAYGAGDSILWDRGHFDTVPPGEALAQRERGRMHVALHGEKLEGAWHLVRTRPRGDKAQWLCFKAKDGTEDPRRDITAERPESVLSGRRQTQGPRRKTRRAAVAARTARVADASPQVALTHPDRLVFPEAGLTKADVFAYFRDVSPVLERAVHGRPLTLQQWPQGIEAPGFFRQKIAHAPKWLRTERLRHGARSVEHAVVDRPESLLWLANQSALTLHMWNSRLPHLDQPDWVAFDLDPGEGGFSDVIEVALRLRGLLEQLGLESVPKTSGKRGLHVLVPVKAGTTYAETGRFAEQVMAALGEALPEIATTERSIQKRKGRLYLDAFQNAWGKTLVAPYVLRALPHAPISTPLRWAEVTRRLAPERFTLKTLRRRLDRVGDLFEPALHGTQRLPELT